ncbi:hypothetical protein KSP40_PGU000676 [Platanthera guangdongensis]|uniref:Uncharacterized protein n=1 Tax=Platanthera guangdongensis TaxID=2320717 RepID=A0ABR2LKU0_9ASPA
MFSGKAFMISMGKLEGFLSKKKTLLVRKDGRKQEISLPFAEYFSIIAFILLSSFEAILIALLKQNGEVEYRETTVNFSRAKASMEESLVSFYMRSPPHSCSRSPPPTHSCSWSTLMASFSRSMPPPHACSAGLPSGVDTNQRCLPLTLPPSSIAGSARIAGVASNYSVFLAS